MVDAPDYEAQLEAMLAKLSPRERKRYERLHEEARTRYEQRLEGARAAYARYQQESVLSGGGSPIRRPGEAFFTWIVRRVRARAGGQR